MNCLVVPIDHQGHRMRSAILTRRHREALEVFLSIHDEDSALMLVIVKGRHRLHDGAINGRCRGCTRGLDISSDMVNGDRFRPGRHAPHDGDAGTRPAILGRRALPLKDLVLAIRVIIHGRNRGEGFTACRIRDGARACRTTIYLLENLARKRMGRGLHRHKIFFSVWTFLLSRYKTRRWDESGRGQDRHNIQVPRRRKISRAKQARKRGTRRIGGGRRRLGLERGRSVLSPQRAHPNVEHNRTRPELGRQPKKRLAALAEVGGT
mmetsp:Transcript_31325/g.75715  ORF Transcript_31325/g.75715 Transcript_31325/m.75715 type:complete len:265 (+) Transcript_31325:543-1337(+)